MHQQKISRLPTTVFTLKHKYSVNKPTSRMRSILGHLFICILTFKEAKK